MSNRVIQNGFMKKAAAILPLFILIFVSLPANACGFLYWLETSTETQALIPKSGTKREAPETCVDVPPRKVPRSEPVALPAVGMIKDEPQALTQVEESTSRLLGTWKVYKRLAEREKYGRNFEREYPAQDSIEIEPHQITFDFEYLGRFVFPIQFVQGGVSLRISDQIPDFFLEIQTNRNSLQFNGMPLRQKLGVRYPKVVKSDWHFAKRSRRR